AFTLAAVVSLVLGIGSSTAIFTLVDAVLFRTVAIAQPGRVYFLGHDPGPALDLTSNYPLFERYRDAPVFSGVTAYQTRSVRIRAGDGIERVPAQFVSGNYHAVLGTAMALGTG